MDFIYATQFTTLTAIEIEIEHFFYYFMPSIIMKRLCVRRAGIYQEKQKAEIIFLFLSFFLFFFSFYFASRLGTRYFFVLLNKKKQQRFIVYLFFFDEVWLTDVALGFWERICTLTVQREG